MNDDYILFIDGEEVFDLTEYHEHLKSNRSKNLDWIQKAIKQFDKFEKNIQISPALVNLIKSTIPQNEWIADFTPDQRTKLNTGNLKLMRRKKDGMHLATLVNPDNNRIVTHIPLKQIKLNPGILESFISLSTQMQLAQISEQMETLHQELTNVKMGLDYDRIAIAYSTEEKLKQALLIKNAKQREMALLLIAQSAEDGKIRLMFNHHSDIQSFLQGSSKMKLPEIDENMSQIRNGLIAINKISQCEAYAYLELGNPKAAIACLTNYSEFIYRTYLEDPNTVRNLDSWDRRTDSYWINQIELIQSNIQALPMANELKQLEE